MASLTETLARLASPLRKRMPLRSRLLRRFMGEAGGSIVEMALSSSILFASFFGFFEASLASFAYQYVSDASREATRWAIVRGSTCSTNTPGLDHCGATALDVQTYIRGLRYPGIVTANLTAATTWYSPSASTPTTWTLCSSGTCNTPGNLVKVNVNYAYGFNIPFGPKKNLTITSTSQMVVQQ